MKPRDVMVTLTIIILSVSALPIASTTDTTQYGMDVVGSIDVPDRTVSFEGNEYEISALSRADAGETLSVDVTAPSEPYSVIIYDSDRMFAANEEGDGSGTFEFDLSKYEPGTYMVAIDSGKFEAMHPLVVRGYSIDMDVDGSQEVTTDDDIDVTVTATKTADVEATKVQVIVADSDDTLRVDATETADGSYQATVQSSELDAGDYVMYAVVRGDEEAFGEMELLGVSGTSALTVSEPSEETSQPTDTETPSEGGMGSQDTTTEPTTTEPTTTETVTSTEPTPTTEGTTEPTPTETTTSESEVITAASPTTEVETETAPPTGQPGFGFLGMVAALVAFVALARRR